VEDLSWLKAIDPATNEPRLVNDDLFLDALTAKVQAFNPPTASTENFGGLGFLNRLRVHARDGGQAAAAARDPPRAASSSATSSRI
jgi:hypothetical protein